MAGAEPVYIVDDAADYRFLVQQVFTMFLPHCSVRFFTDGADLVHHITFPDASYAVKPRLIVLDLDMPGLNGLQTLEHLKRHTDWQAVPVVMMTNRDSSDFMKESFRLGAEAFLLKPQDLMGIKTVMSQLCDYEGNLTHLIGSNGRPT